MLWDNDRRKFRGQIKLPTIWTGGKAEVGRVREMRKEERRSEKRKSQRKEDAGARKGRKVAKHCVFPMICGTGGFKSRLAKAAGAKPSGQMRDEKLHTVVARSTFPSQNAQSTPTSDHFWKLRCQKSAHGGGVKHISKSKRTIHYTSCSDHFWAQYFKQTEWKNRKTHWYKAVTFVLNFPFLKEVSHNCFVFDVVNLENWGSLAELLRFWRCQVQKLRQSRRIAAFSSLRTDRQTDR